jgi:hypothetical protein
MADTVNSDPVEEPQQTAEQTSVTASEGFAYATVIALVIISFQYRAVLTEVAVLESLIVRLLAIFPFLFAMLILATVVEWVFNRIGGVVGIDLDRPFSELDRAGVVFTVIPLSLGTVAATLHPFGLSEFPAEMLGLLIGLQLVMSSVYPLIAARGLLGSPSTTGFGDTSQEPQPHSDDEAGDQHD